MNPTSKILKLLFILFAINTLAACGGGGDSDNSNPGSSSSGTNITLPDNTDTTDTTDTTPSDYTGAATLTWLPPTENVDGSTLGGISHYNIYYGTEIGNYTSKITIDNPGITEYMIDNLPGNNTYYFVVTAVDTLGYESGFSNVASKSI